MTLVIQPPGPGVPNYTQADTPGYGAYAQPFSATAERLPAKSFSMDVVIDPRRFAAAREVNLRWAFDSRPPLSGKPWGMGNVFFGNHDGGIVPGAFKAVLFEGMKRLDIAWDADLRAVPDTAALLSDTYLYDAAGKKLLELGVFGLVSGPGMGWALKCPSLGSFVSDNITWNVRVDGGYVMVIPTSAQLRHNFNMLDLRAFLKAKGTLPAGALFPSTALGIEPALGCGSCRVGLTVVTG